MGLWAIMVIQEWPHPPVFDKPETLDSRGLYIFTRPATGRYAHPCVRAADGTPVFFAYGGRRKPFPPRALTRPRPPVPPPQSLPLSPTPTPRPRARPRGP